MRTSWDRYLAWFFAGEGPWCQWPSNVQSKLWQEGLEDYFPLEVHNIFWSKNTQNIRGMLCFLKIIGMYLSSSKSSGNCKFVAILLKSKKVIIKETSHSTIKRKRITIVPIFYKSTFIQIQLAVTYYQMASFPWKYELEKNSPGNDQTPAKQAQVASTWVGGGYILYW